MPERQMTSARPPEIRLPVVDSQDCQRVRDLFQQTPRNFVGVHPECDLNALVLGAEGLDLLLVSARGDIRDEEGKVTSYLNSQFMIILQKNDRANISKREGGKISKK
jgi:hypothetical protein